MIKIGLEAEMATTDDGPLGGKKRTHEEDYFRKQDQELIDKMRRAAAVAQSRQELGEKTGLHDPSLLNDLEALGFAPDTVSLLPLVPLIQVAWAEGGVSGAERSQIEALARKRGIAEGSAADIQLSDWLSARPREEIFAGATRLIRAMLAAGSAETRDLTADDLVKYCENIAAASGGVLGIGKVSAEERAALAQIAARLQTRQ
jgi:hypothetical protein